MTKLIGIVLVTLGVVIFFWGDKEVTVKGGLILRLFSWRRGSARWAKWLVGAALVYAGMNIIFAS